MFVNLVHSIFALRKAKVCRNMYATISFKSVVWVLKIITKFVLFRSFKTYFDLLLIYRWMTKGYYNRRRRATGMRECFPLVVNECLVLEITPMNYKIQCQ